MDGQFIYVFDKNDRDVLVASGFTLLKSNEKNDTYVFLDTGARVFDLSEKKFARSNTLIF